MSKIVLFVSVHPDDESFGCGGTILKHKNKGDSINWLNLTARTKDHPGGFNEERYQKRVALTRRIADSYGFERFHNLELQTGLLDTYSLFELVNRIDSVISEVEPEIIYLPNRSDVHTDHRIGFTAVYSTTKSFRKPYIKQILMYETLSETEFAPAVPESMFTPNTYVDITDYMARKLEIVRMYDTELMPAPMPRSEYAIKSLAGYRESRIGVRYAEAFQSIYRVL